MHTFRNILVGVDIESYGDLTASSKEALKQAGRIGLQHNASLTVVHVINMSPDTFRVIKLQPQQASAEAERTINRAMEEITALAKAVRFRSIICFGAHWKELLKLALEEQIDLLVLGTRARNSMGRVQFGSTNNRLLRYCPCPVWVVRESKRGEYRDILVANDMSDVGANALSIGATMASLYSAKLHVLHVIEHVEQRQFLGSIPEHTLNAREHDVRTRLEEQCRALVTGSRVEIQVCTGSPQTEILDYLRKNKNDLICMGTVARTGLSGIVTGNTAESVLPWIDCGLIAVKPAEFQPPHLS